MAVFEKSFMRELFDFGLRAAAAAENTSSSSGEDTDFHLNTPQYSDEEIGSDISVGRSGSIEISDRNVPAVSSEEENIEEENNEESDPESDGSIRGRLV